jgi:hypothetical protein
MAVFVETGGGRNSLFGGVVAFFAGNNSRRADILGDIGFGETTPFPSGGGIWERHLRFLWN